MRPTVSSRGRGGYRGHSSGLTLAHRGGSRVGIGAGPSDSPSGYKHRPLGCRGSPLQRQSLEERLLDGGR